MLAPCADGRGRAGSLTLKIKIAPASKGGDVDKVTITADRKLELGMPVEALKSRLISPN